MNIIFPWISNRYSFILILLILIIIPNKSVGQRKYALEPRIGYGTFQMNSLKEFQKTIQTSLPFETKVTDEFPSFYQFGLKGSYLLKENSLVGVLLERGSTGGRIHYADYSGHFRADQLLRYTLAGILAEKKLGSSAIPFLYGAELNILYNTLKLKNEIKVYDEEQAENLNLIALGGAVKPYCGAYYSFNNWEGKLTLGYFFNKNMAFINPKEPNQSFYRNNDEDKLDPNWSGLRINFSVLYYLNL